jgi:hypothetical protein
MDFQYDKVIELNALTCEQCLELYKKDNICTILSNGEVINLLKEE